MKTTCPVLLTSFLICSLFGMQLRGQEDPDDLRMQYAGLVKKAYGQDQELVNGRQYYNRHPLSAGSPYLFDGLLQQGSATFRGVRYDHLYLRYNIFSQQVEIEYNTISGASNRVVSAGDRMETFSIGPLSFKRMMLDEDEEKIFQVAGYGSIVFYIHWEKNLVPVHNDTEHLEAYTSSRSYVTAAVGDAFYRVRNLKQLNALLPEEIQKEVKQLFRTREFNFRTATPVEMDVIFKSVSTLVNQGSA